MQKQKASLLVKNRGETHLIQRTCSVLPLLLLSLSRSTEGSEAEMENSPCNPKE